LHKYQVYDQCFFMHISQQIVVLRAQSNHSLVAVAELSQRSIPTVRSVEAGTGSIGSMLAVLRAIGGVINWQGNGMAQLGTAFADERKSHGISQRSMASMIGVTQPTIIALEVRDTGRMATLQNYADALNIQIRVRMEKQPKQKPRLIPKKNDTHADRVFTPTQLAAQIIEHLPLSGHVLDPCRGGGAFFGQFPDHVVPHWCEIDNGRDFLTWQKPVDWIVTNPPWSKFRSFLTHGMTIADNVVYLAAFTHFTTKARVRDIQSHGFGMRSIIYVPTPKEWPSSGFQMAAVWLQRGYQGPCEMVHRLP
jgi:transcriptional regulator with XRE-family HTH domain